MNPLLPTNTPLYDCDSLPKLGGYVRLRLCYAKSILQQRYQSEVELSEIIFLESENWVADWTYADRFVGELKIEGQLADVGLDEKHSLKAILEVDCDQQDFKIWFNRILRGRRLCVELTAENDLVRRMNPFMVGYTYLGNPNFENINHYELTFSRAKWVDYMPDLSENNIAEIEIDCFA